MSLDNASQPQPTSNQPLLPAGVLMSHLQRIATKFCMEEVGPLGERLKADIFAAADGGVDINERNLLMTSYQGLLKGGKTFARALAISLPQALQTAMLEEQAKRSNATLLADELTLVEVDDVELEVLVTNAVRKLNDYSQETLSPLTLRICHLRNLTVDLASNPFRPEVFLKGFIAAWADFDGNRLSTRAVVRALALKAFLPLNALYQDLNLFLIENNVLRQQRYVIKRPSSADSALWQRAEPQQAAGGTVAMPGLAAGAAGIALPNLDAALSNAHLPAQMPAQAMAAASGGYQFDPTRFMQQVTLLLERTSVQNSPAGASQPGASVAQAVAPNAQLIAKLDTILANQVAIARANSNEPRAPSLMQLDALRKAEETTHASELDQASIDMVYRVFDFVHRETALPMDLRLRISDLQLAVLKAALVDRKFFMKEEHPARRLIDLLTRCVFYWRSDAEHKDQDANSIRATVDSVVERARVNKGDPLSLMEALAAELAKELAVREEQERVKEQRIIQQEIENERRLHAGNEVHTRIERRIAQNDLNPLVVNFLRNPWQTFLVQCYLSKESDPTIWEEALRQTDTLIWSLAPKSSNTDRKRMVSMLPDMLRFIMAGTNRVAWDDTERKQFMEYLMSKHAVIVRQLYSAEALASNGMTQPMFFTDDLEDQQSVSPLIESAPAVLVRGSWVALDLGLHEPLLFRLSWVSPKRTKYIFFSSERNETLVKSEEEVRELMRTAALKPVETGSLVGRAIAATVSARR
jgi:hypothetical protein